MLRRFLEGLTARHGIFGVTGNHDGYDLPANVRGMNVRLIDGRQEMLRMGEAAVELIGLPGPKRADFNPAFVRRIGPREQGVPRIVLSHFPDAIRRIERLQADLFLTGHTHGGQICLPRGLPLIRHDTLPRRLCAGVHRWGQTWLIAHRGFGFTKFNLRLFCPAELVELTLV